MLVLIEHRSKIAETSFSLSARKICPLQIYGQNSESKTDVELKTDLQIYQSLRVTRRGM